MKFAIVSDTHDNLKNFNKVINWLNAQGIELLLHCGDICTHATIEEAHKNFKGEILYVKGNGDYMLEEILPERTLEIDNKKIFFVHFPDIAHKAAQSGKYDLVFYGHTHRPWEEKIGDPSTGASTELSRMSSGRACRLVNPGEVAGQRYKPCFATYDTETDTLELKILEKL